MSTETVEIAFGLNAHFLNVPLASAQGALLAQIKAAGNDVSALSAKAGTSIADGEMGTFWTSQPFTDRSGSLTRH